MSEWFRCPTCRTRYELYGHHPACPEALLDEELAAGPPDDPPQCCDIGYVWDGDNDGQRCPNCRRPHHG